MLVRDGAVAVDPGAREHVLAACPDSPERGDEWRWTVSRVQPESTSDPWTVAVRVDETFLDVEHTVVDRPGEIALARSSGEEIVVVVERGQHLIQDAVGPWLRYLQPGDVFVVEGEEHEHLVLTASGQSRASVVRLSPKGDQPLRWVP